MRFFSRILVTPAPNEFYRLLFSGIMLGFRWQAARTFYFQSEVREIQVHCGQLHDRRRRHYEGRGSGKLELPRFDEVQHRHHIKQDTIKDGHEDSKIDATCPAVPTAVWSSRLRSGSAHCDLELADEEREEEEKKEEEAGSSDKT
eukprot:s234_g32.t1